MGTHIDPLSPTLVEGIPGGLEAIAKFGWPAATAVIVVMTTIIVMCYMFRDSIRELIHKKVNNETDVDRALSKIGKKDAELNRDAQIVSDHFIAINKENKELRLAAEKKSEKNESKAVKEIKELKSMVIKAQDDLHQFKKREPFLNLIPTINQFESAGSNMIETPLSLMDFSSTEAKPRVLEYDHESLLTTLELITESKKDKD